MPTGVLMFIVSLAMVTIVVVLSLLTRWWLLLRRSSPAPPHPLPSGSIREDRE